jgi:4-amino-4-deoxychorismate lyase
MNPVVYNFALLPPEQLPIILNDRAFTYGDGLFETIIYNSGQIRFWPSHFRRLRSGMEALGLLLPEGFTMIALEEQMQQLLQANQLTRTARLRLQVWRKPGGWYTPASGEINYLITAQECSPPQLSAKQQVFFYEEVRLHASAISAYKTCNALPYVLAGIAKSRANADDMILLDMAGHLSECIASNLFWWKQDIFYTPSLQAGCVAGVMRERLIQYMQEEGRGVREGLFGKGALWDADGVFCCNVAGIQWIKQVGNHHFPERNRREITEILQQLVNLPQ